LCQRRSILTAWQGGLRLFPVRSRIDPAARREAPPRATEFPAAGPLPTKNAVRMRTPFFRFEVTGAGQKFGQGVDFIIPSAPLVAASGHHGSRLAPGHGKTCREQPQRPSPRSHALSSERDFHLGHGETEFHAQAQAQVLQQAKSQFA
jgi:hypothetical protein